jgi:GT2 family glycosyltransferase
MSETVSIVIPTHDRCAELLATLRELRRLDPPPEEIIVWLDGCTDGTAAALRDFPEVGVVAGDRREGSIPARDSAFRMARGDLIVSLDDDSFPLATDFVRRIGELAAQHPEAGAFAFREIRPCGARPPLSRTPEPRKAYVAAYPNCAGAIRRGLYGELTAYPRFFSHAYAEPDFCLQAYAAGYGVLFAPEIEIFHRFTHAQRDMKARHHRNARNELWSVVMRCPFPHVLWIGAYRIARQLVFAASRGWDWLKAEPRWLAEAFGRLDEPLAARRPVPWRVYRTWLRMARRPLDGRPAALARAFPHMAEAGTAGRALPGESGTASPGDGAGAVARVQ